jgi:hypothetical protein
MVFKRGDALKMVTQGLAWIKTTCEYQGRLKLLDDHVLAQHFFLRVLNVAYGLRLEAMDRIRPNYPAIDLGDRTNKVAFQVTTERSGDKVQHTLDKFVEHGLHRDFDLLRILIIGEPQRTYKTVVIPEELTFDCGCNILGLSGLVKHIDTLATPRIVEIAGILRQESKPRTWLRSLLRLSEPGGLPEAWNQKRNLSSVITAPGPAATYTPYGTSTHSRVPKAPAKSPPGPADSKGSI